MGVCIFAILCFGMLMSPCRGSEVEALSTCRQLEASFQQLHMHDMISETTQSNAINLSIQRLTLSAMLCILFSTLWDMPCCISAWQ